MVDGMTTLTGRQARQAQIDAWQDRHGVQAYKTVPMTDQTAQAVYRDHVEALEMNANGDAGRDAFLGQPMPLSPRQRTEVALRMIADAIRLESLPNITSTSLWAQNLPALDLLNWAYRFNAKITVHEPVPGGAEGHASMHTATVGRATDEPPWVDLYVTSRDVSALARSRYEAHNAGLES